MSLSLKCAQALRAKIEELVQGSGMTAEEALSCAVMLPAWEPGREYVKGQRVRHGGQLYECVETHTSQSDWAPGAATAALWKPVTIDPATGYDEWKQPTGAHDAYNKGDRVVYKGEVYESLIDGNAYSPEAYPAGWKKVDG